MWELTPKQKGDYTRLYEYILPKTVKALDPQTYYWPSSPSSGGDFDNPSDETRGDVHYWDVWHGQPAVYGLPQPQLPLCFRVRLPGVPDS